MPFDNTYATSSNQLTFSLVLTGNTLVHTTILYLHPRSHPFTHSVSQTASANLQPSSLSQVLALAVLSRWGHQGFLTHTQQVSEFYRAKRDIFEAALRRNLDGLVEWDTPEAGMFIWCVAPTPELNNVAL